MGAVSVVVCIQRSRIISADNALNDIMVGIAINRSCRPYDSSIGLISIRRYCEHSARHSTGTRIVRVGEFSRGKFGAFGNKRRYSGGRVEGPCPEKFVFTPIEQHRTAVGTVPEYR